MFVTQESLVSLMASSFGSPSSRISSAGVSLTKTLGAAAGASGCPGTALRTSAQFGSLAGIRWKPAGRVAAGVHGPASAGAVSQLCSCRR